MCFLFLDPQNEIGPSVSSSVVLSRGHQNTRKILKRKKVTDTQYENKARFDGQRIGKLKVATWDVRVVAEKTEELQTELLKRKIGIAIIIITETKVVK